MLLASQMNMLVYQCLDLVSEQYARLKTREEHEKIRQKYNESCYLGLIFETTLSDYEFDVFAYVSPTRYKYIMVKNEEHRIQQQLG